jgi:O-methyltransferase
MISKEKLWGFQNNVMNKFLAKNTMVGKKGRIQFEQAIQQVIQLGIPGDFVECGVWRGGLAGLMLSYIVDYKLDKKLYLYDTFSGMTEPSDKDCNKAIETFNSLKDDNSEFANWCRASTKEVEEVLITVTPNYKNYVKFIIGKVEDTLIDHNNLPKVISLLHLDTDWYHSTLIELQTLYPLLSPDGILIVDDYKKNKNISKGWDGCTDAVNEFFSNSNNVIEKLPNFDHDKILTGKKINNE